MTSFKERMISVRGALCVFLGITTVVGAAMLFYCFHKQDQSFAGAVNGTVTGLPSQYSEGSSLTFLVSAMTLAPLLNVLAYIFHAQQWVVISTGLTSVLSPAFIVQLAFFSACENTGSKKCGSYIKDVDPEVAMAGYILMILSVYFSFLLVPTPVRTFQRQKHRVFLGLALFISFITLVAAILFFVAAGEVKNVDGFWSIAQSDFVSTGVQNMNAVFFFLGAVFLRSEPFGHAALFYLSSFYVVPLLPALNSNSLNDLTNPTGAPGGDVLNENTFLAASGLGYAGVVLMAVFLLHRFRYNDEHNDDRGDDHPYDKIDH